MVIRKKNDHVSKIIFNATPEQFALLQTEHAQLMMKYGIDEHLLLVHHPESGKTLLDKGSHHIGPDYFRAHQIIILHMLGNPEQFVETNVKPIEPENKTGTD